MKYTVICLFLCFLQTYGAILGANKCTWGPSFWCQNIENANACGAIQHCKSRVWNKPVQDDELCLICKEGMEFVDNYLKENSTESKIENGLMQLCAKLPGDFGPQCKKLVSENFVMIYDELLTILGNGDMVCSALGLCSSSARNTDDKMDLLAKRLPSLLKEALENDQLPKAIPVLVRGAPIEIQAPIEANVEMKSDDCQDCHMFVKEVQSIIMNNKTVSNNWLMLIKKECDVFGPGIDEICQQTVGDALSTLANQNGVDDVDTICKSMEMCSFKSKQVVGNDMCADCKNFMEDWQYLIKNNKTIINEIVTNVASFYCLQKPLYMRKQCNRYVAMVIETALNRLAHESPTDICTAIYFCDAEPEVQENTKALEQHKDGVSDADKYCKDCTQFMVDLQSVAKNNQSLIDDLTDLIKEECDMLGPDIADLCKKAADQVVSAAVSAISNNDVNVICNTILMCPSGSSNNPDPGNLCSDCIAFTQDWQAISVNNQSIIQGLLDKALKSLCNQIASPYQDQCIASFGSKGSKFFDFFTKIDAETICSTIYFCFDEKKEVNVAESVPAVIEEVSDDKYCTDCCQFMVDLQQVAKNNQSIIDNIKALITQQCDTLGPVISELCKSQVPVFINNNLVNFENLDVNVICNTLMVCPAGTSNQPKPGNLCNDCVAFAQNWQSIIQNNQSLIDTLLKNFENLYCNQLPFVLKGECDSVMKTAETNIRNFFKNHDAETICSTMYMCDGVRKIHLALPQPEQHEIRSVMPQAKSKAENPVTCFLCKMVVHELDSLIRGNETTAQIVSILEKVCDIYSGDIKSQCKSFVKEYGKEIVDLLIREMESGVICSHIFLCSEQPTVSKQVEASTSCELCDLIATMLDNMLTSNSSEAEIVVAVKKVCKLLPQQYESECNSLIDLYGPQIIQLFAQYMDPAKICPLLGLCPKQLKDKPLCDVCEVIAQELDHLLTENSTESEITAAVDKVCGVLPSSFKDECDALIHQYGPQIINALVNQLSPSKLCATIGLCTSQFQLKDNTDCELCKLIAQELHQILTQNSTESEILAAVEKVCGVLPSSFKEECDALIHQYGPQIINALVQDLSPDKLCSTIGLCTSQLQQKDDANCDICKLIAQELEQLLTQNSTESEILAAVDKVCGILPSSFKDECDALIHQYGTQIISALAQDLNPDKLCATIGLCSSQLQQKDDANCDICKLIAQELDQLLTQNSTESEILAAVEKVCGILPSSFKDECDALIHQYGTQIISALAQDLNPDKLCATIGLCTSQLQLKDDPGCEVCKLIAQELDQVLTQNSTESEIIAAVEKVCGILPSSIKSECDDLIDQYGPEIINALAQDLTPDQICTTIKLCTAQVVKLGDACELCDLIAQALEGFLESQSTEEEIKKAVEKVCSALPESYQGSCTSLIEQYGSTIIELLVNLVPPEKLCSTLGICSSVSSSEKSDQNCEICKLVADELENLLKANSTQQEIVEAISKVCTILPTTLQTQCADFLATNGQALLKLLLQQFPPSKICAELKLCSTSKKIASVANDNLCDICKVVIEFIDQELSSNATRAEVEKALETVCDRLPSSLRQTCDDIVQQYTPEILDLMDNIFDPSYVCLHLKLCPAARRPEVLIGANHCTYGPSYWCKNENTAKECHALEHCRRHVWD